MSRLKFIIIIAVIVLLSFSGHSQEAKLHGSVSTIDTADLSILKIHPDSFPLIGVVFKAETRKGEPLWNLTKEQMLVKENNISCEVVSIEPISKNESIHIAIVIDHSKSMQQDFSQLFDRYGNFLGSFDEYYNPVLPPGYITPIESVKKAVKHFVSRFNTNKDSISIIGFSTEVDEVVPLTQDLGLINSKVDAMQTEGITALYDAIEKGIESVRSVDGVKVVVVLTDGMDNASKTSWQKVVEQSKRTDIPIYVIGLGDVNKEILKKIATRTNGHFYYAQKADALQAIYDALGKKIQAFYHLSYRSSNFTPTDTNRQITLSFDIDSIYLVTSPKTVMLPKTVVAYLVQKQQQQKAVVWGSVAFIVSGMCGSLFFYFRKKRKDEKKATADYS